MSRFPIDGGGFIGVDEDVEEKYGSVRGGVFLGEGEVFSEGVEVGSERNALAWGLSLKAPRPSSTKWE